MSGPRYRYSRWDGTQEFDEPDADRVLDAISDDLLSYGDVGHALQRLQRWGDQDLGGVEDLLDRLRHERDEELQRYQLDSSLDELRHRLERVVELEREGIQRRLGEATGDGRRLMERIAQARRQELDQMPDDLGGKVGALRRYDFVDAGARQEFEKMLDELQGQFMQQTFQGLKQGIQSLHPSDLSHVREMVRDLNRLLEERARGGEGDFAEFMRKHQGFFPPGIGDLDSLLRHLQEQMAQMESFLRSLSPQARAELQRLMDELLQDDSLRLDLARLAGLMDQLAPPSALAEGHPFFGQEPISLRQAMQLMDRLHQMSRLQGQLEQARSKPERVDPDLLEALMGPDARSQLERTKSFARLLEEAGYVEKRDGRLQLTARGIRRLGQGALRQIFAHITRSKLGGHVTRETGQGTEMGEDSKPYEFGDPFMIDLRETLFNALRRDGSRLPLRLSAEDFAVHRTLHTSQAATVLMIDMSRSMFLRGCFLAAKKVAIALDSLIRSQFPRDHLYLVGFSSHAVRMKAESLPQVALDDYVYGTNMQDGFQMAGRLLSRHGGQRQVIMITDGEPTAHTEGGRVVFAYPPTFRTIQATLGEVRRLTKDGVVINTFMLERSRYLTDFVSEMARINRGRAFYVAPERLGEYVVDDFVSGRRRRSRAS